MRQRGVFTPVLALVILFLILSGVTSIKFFSEDYSTILGIESSSSFKNFLAKLESFIQKGKHRYSTPEVTPNSPTPLPTQQIISPGNSYYGIHSFITPNYSTSTKAYLFDAAQRTGKRL